jgi:hypothetical protein
LGSLAAAGIGTGVVVKVALVDVVSIDGDLVGVVLPVNLPGTLASFVRMELLGTGGEVVTPDCVPVVDFVGVVIFVLLVGMLFVLFVLIGFVGVFTFVLVVSVGLVGEVGREAEAGVGSEPGRDSEGVAREASESGTVE